MKDQYSITDIEKYAQSLRTGVAESFTETYTENLDEFITITQITNLIKQRSLGVDKDNQYIVTEEIIMFIFDEIREWMYGVGLAKLSAKGYVDCAWDIQSNKMIFWLPNNNQTPISSEPS